MCGLCGGPGSTARASPPALPAPVSPPLCGAAQGPRWGQQEARGGTRWTRWENGTVRASGVAETPGAVEGTHTGRQAFPQGTSPHSRGSFSCSWFIRGPNPPRPPARGSLTDGGGGGAPDLGPSGPAPCSRSPSPPGSLALPAPLLPLSSLTGLQCPADARRSGLSRYLAAVLLAKRRVSAAF